MTTSPASAGSGRRYRGVSEAVRRHERRQRFIEAGLSVFTTRGYHQSTVRSICASARLTERYFYESFAHSEDLLEAVYLYAVQRVKEHTVTAFAVMEDQPEAIIEAALTAFFEALAEDPRLARMLFVEVLGVSTRIDGLYRQAVSDFADLFRLVSVRLGPRAVRLPDGIHPDVISVGLVGSVVAVASRWLLTDLHTPVPELVRSLYHLYSQVLLAPPVHQSGTET